MKEETPPKTAEEIQLEITKRALETFPNGTYNDHYFDMLQECRREGFEEGATWAFASTPTSKQEGEGSKEIFAFAKRCFYAGFTACEKDDANCFTAWREQARNLLGTLSEAATQQEGRREEAFLLHLIDITWNTVTESREVPDPDWSMQIIEKARASFPKSVWYQRLGRPKDGLAASIPPNKGKEAESEKVRVLFGLEAQGHIPTIEAMLKEWGQSSYHIWNEIGKKIGWCPLTACAWYLEYILNKQVKEE